MTSGPSVVLCLHRVNAVGRLLDVLGPSDARAAKKQSQFYLRGSFGEDSIKNGFYGKVLKNWASLWYTVFINYFTFLERSSAHGLLLYFVLCCN